MRKVCAVGLPALGPPIRARRQEAVEGRACDPQRRDRTGPPTAAHWDQWNRDQRRQGLTSDRRAYLDGVLHEVVTRLPEGSTLLDIGFGGGFTTEQLQGRFRYLGVELGEESVRAVRRRCPTARLLCSDWLDADLPETFDGVLCMDTLPYFDDRQPDAVAKMARALRPGGLLVLSLVNPFIYSRLAWRQREGKPWGKWLDAKELDRLVARAGFALTSMRTLVPSGDRGWLRALNSRKLKRVLGQRYLRALERFGLGQFRVLVARKR